VPGLDNYGVYVTNQIRVRYAPSPTGFPHVGNIRTALFNWLFACHNGGRFIIRIEDTDRARYTEGSTEAILDSLKWLGLDWDEGPEVEGEFGPYFQSQRREIYLKATEELVTKGQAYYCYCTPDRLAEMRAEQVINKQSPGYNRHCRNLTKQEIAEKEAANISRVIRFKFPMEGKTRFKDLIRGDVEFENTRIDDFVILKSDGYPTYHLASVADDHLMKISHILRGEEWISSTPKHIKLNEALGYQLPEFAHLPMILGKDRSKLSKRHGTVSITEYRRQGYLPEALLNFLALLGWALDDKTELFTKDELIRHFSLERISKAAAIFNSEKLEWMNGVYIRNLSLDELTERALPFLTYKKPLDKKLVRSIMQLVQERIKKLDELPEMTDFFFVEDIDHDLNIFTEKETAIKALEASQDKLKSIVDFSEEKLEIILRSLAEELSLKTGQLFGAIRNAVTGKKVTPPLFGTMAVLGKERCLERICKALARLNET
jgi:glutamyl-tRNA synthetase